MERRIEVRAERDDGAFGGGGRTLSAIFQEAETRGLDTGREFRACFHRALGYVEFWQEPLPVPNAGHREREPAAVEAAS